MSHRTDCEGWLRGFISSEQVAVALKLIKEAERYATRPSGYLEPESVQIGKLETHKGSQFKQTVSHFSLASYYFCTFCSKS